MAVAEKAKEQEPDLKVVLMTGYINQQTETLLHDRKADGFLVKSIKLEKLKKPWSGRSASRNSA